MILHDLNHLAELVVKPLHSNSRSLRLLCCLIHIPSCYETERVPYLVVEVTSLLDLRLIIENVVTCRAAEKHTETHCVCTVFRDEVERIRRVSESLRHLASELVANDTCEVYVAERYIVHKLVSGHNHTCHPEEENIRTCHEVVCRIVVCEILVRLSLRMTCLVCIEDRDRPEPR